MEKKSEAKNILIIGGSGFASGTLARRSLAAGHHVWVLTRGLRSLPSDVISLQADRHDIEAFESAINDAGTEWDLVVDYIGFEVADVEQDIRVFRERASHLVFVSTDFVYDPNWREYPQREKSEHYLKSGYGGKKRLCELALARGDTGSMAWTVVRPCHIYGPGSQLGCLPAHSRDLNLVARLRAGEALSLVGGGYFLQQPIHAADLADVILAMVGNAATRGEIFCVAGPDIIESRAYYQIIADYLGVQLTIEEISVSGYLSQFPESAPFLCHRIYDTAKLGRAGVLVPSIPIKQGLEGHVSSLLST